LENLINVFVNQRVVFDGGCDQAKQIIVRNQTIGILVQNDEAQKVDFIQLQGKDILEQTQL